MIYSSTFIKKNVWKWLYRVCKYHWRQSLLLDHPCCYCHRPSQRNSTNSWVTFEHQFSNSYNTFVACIFLLSQPQNLAIFITLLRYASFYYYSPTIAIGLVPCYLVNTSAVQLYTLPCIFCETNFKSWFTHFNLGYVKVQIFDNIFY